MENNVITRLEDLNLVDKFLFDEVMEDRGSYQAQLDVSLLEPGSINFNLLNNSCFILIAPFDIFGRGLYRYTFEGTCRECPDLKLGDGAVRVFINTAGINREDFSQEFLDLMKYVTETTDVVAGATESSKIKLIHNRVKKIKLSEKMGGKYMQRWEEMVYATQEGISQGIARGRTEGEQVKLIKLVCKKLAKNEAPEKIAEDLEEETSTILPICEMAEEFAPEYDSEKVYEKYCISFPDSLETEVKQKESEEISG